MNLDCSYNVNARPYSQSIRTTPMMKYRKLAITFLILLAFGILIFRSFRYDWNPHYIDNNEVAIGKKLFSPDISIAVVYYTLDVGTRGIRPYKSLLRKKDYGYDMTKYSLPPQLVVLKWVDNRTLNVKYDPNEKIRIGGGLQNLTLHKTP